MRHTSTRLLRAAALALPLAALSLVTTSASAAAPGQTASPDQNTAPAPVSPARLVSQIDIPYQTFTLPNGLTTIVHTDRKAPIVGVTVYYRVGSKNEPRGHTGFAHLYEHLFFGGSANVPNFDIPLEAAGSTATNGSTWYDRTNYVETVPTGALDLALFMESDRMGDLLPAVSQAKLDKQRGVVQNEKRQGDNQPYGLVEYAEAQGLLPIGHPYRHTTIGSMADLDAATLTDVRRWYTEHYGPNNVVLVLSGDIDAATARPKVEKWFGWIPRGPAVKPVKAGPVTLPAPRSIDVTDQVPVLRLMREWTGPGVNGADTPALQVGLYILGGLGSSRLDNALVRGSQQAVAVTASDDVQEELSFLRARMDVKPGVSRTDAEAAFDKVIEDFIAKGPSADEVRRAVTSILSSQIDGLERVGGFSGKGVTLAEGELYSGNPAKYKQDLAAMAALTPHDVQVAVARWMGRPVLKLAVVPGERTMNGDTLGGWGDEATMPARAKDPHAEAAPLPPGPERSAPPVSPVKALQFPAIERTTLSNGIPVILARRTAIPKVDVAIDFDAGYAADALDTPGTQGLMLAMLDQGTTTRSATQIAEDQERLGAAIRTGASLDQSTVMLSALSANLAPSLALTADLVLHPAFAAADVARMKGQSEARLAQVMASPAALAARTLSASLYGDNPYAQPSDGLGNAKSLAALTTQDLSAAQHRWLRPDLARITVVGDITMAQLKPLLEASFGHWQAPATPRPVKPIATPVPAPSARIVLIDRPNSPQSVIMAGRVLDLTGRDAGTEPLTLANDVLGGDFLSRLNSDIREEKGWSYGVASGVTQPLGRRALMVRAPVQSDKTGPAIAAILADMKAFPSQKPVNPVELQRVTEGTIRGLPNHFETNAAVLSAIRRDDLLGRPDDYYATLPATLRAIDAQAIGKAAQDWLQPAGLTFVIVGDRSVVEPQLKALGLPVEVLDTTGTPSDVTED